MSGEVISINRKNPEPPTLICGCGSAWFMAAVCFDGQSVTGYSLPVKCFDCGQEVTP